MEAIQEATLAKYASINQECHALFKPRAKLKRTPQLVQHVVFIVTHPSMHCVQICTPQQILSLLLSIRYLHIPPSKTRLTMCTTAAVVKNIPMSSQHPLQRSRSCGSHQHGVSMCTRRWRLLQIDQDFFSESEAVRSGTADTETRTTWGS
jgi:hypothetical protein